MHLDRRGRRLADRAAEAGWRTGPDRRTAGVAPDHADAWRRRWANAVRDVAAPLSQRRAAQGRAVRRRFAGDTCRCNRGSARLGSDLIRSMKDKEKEEKMWKRLG